MLCCMIYCYCFAVFQELRRYFYQLMKTYALHYFPDLFCSSHQSFSDSTVYSLAFFTLTAVTIHYTFTLTLQTENLPFHLPCLFHPHHSHHPLYLHPYTTDWKLTFPLTLPFSPSPLSPSIIPSPLHYRLKTYLSTYLAFFTLTALTIHYTFTLSLQTENLPFHKSFPP